VRSAVSHIFPSISSSAWLYSAELEAAAGLELTHNSSQLPSSTGGQAAGSGNPISHPRLCQPHL